MEKGSWNHIYVHEKKGSLETLNGSSMASLWKPLLGLLFLVKGQWDLLVGGAT